MKCSVALLVLGVAVAAVSAAPSVLNDKHEIQLPDNFDVTNKILVNDFFDELLENMREYLIANNMVPMALPSSLQGFCVRYLFVDWHGELELTEGTLVDLTTISRKGDAEVVPGITQTHMKAVIGIDLLDMHYDYLAYVMNIGPDGGIEAKVTKMKFNVDIAVNLLTQQAHLDDFSILKTGHLDVSLSGTVVIDEIFNAISDVITFFFKNTIMDLIASAIQNAINGALEHTPVPTSPAPQVYYERH